MGTKRWQKQHINFQSWVWGISAIISTLVIVPLLLLGYGIEVAGVFFIIIFVFMRVALALIFNNRYANSMVRILKLDSEEIERDFRFLFKEHHINFKRWDEESGYRYDFPWRDLSMIVKPFWLSSEQSQPVTKVTLSLLNAKNQAFAEKLAESIDHMERVIQSEGKRE